MQLSANKTAKFFIQNEYHTIALDEHYLVLSSDQSEERIPFNIWNGRIDLKRGILNGAMQIFAHPEQGKQQSWLVQGLPWKSCRQFARHALNQYQHWHHTQCMQLVEFLPKWEERVSAFERAQHFVPHSELTSWLESAQQDFSQMSMTLLEAQQRLPNRMKPISPWIENSEQSLAKRNTDWIINEIDNWEMLFSQIESSPLNLSQKQAVLLNDNNNLVLAGAGSGKTSVLTARVAYLLQSHMAQAEEILLLAFGRDAANEMKQRLVSKVGPATEQVRVNTFHQLGLYILRQVEGNQVDISPLALDDKQRQAWCTDWLKRHWMTPTSFKRWQKHLAQWPIAYIKGDDELGSHAENPKLIAWLESQMMQLAAMGCSKKQIQEQIVSHAEYSRLNSELALVWPCFQAWQTMLKEQNQIDFNTMISRANEYVRKGKFTAPWKYIMIDEYQDISPQRLELIEALCQHNRHQDSVLFAVGDDWQSIYQFAGSDVDLTTGFSQRFPNSTLHYLDTTYRFNNQLGMVANQFIQQNPNQLNKQLNSHKEHKSKAVVLIPMANVEKILDQIDRKSKQRATVMLLARNHYHKPELLADWQRQFSMLDIEFMTCHASKGREADYVIILNVDEGQFPARVKTQHLDSVLTQSKDTFPYAEERRLFYVALTRAKKKVWVAYNGSGSSFVKELKEGDYAVQSTN
ncbi:DNA helicase IV [Vibrio taketomensis]|uniref:DNA helicase IV n=1 Tax=Vibrio taketomensis TaxID=2572923 RepID=UPI001389DBFB|nr:DNA helicase IV [Vibrio taketomensis]